MSGADATYRPIHDLRPGILPLAAVTLGVAAIAVAYVSIIGFLLLAAATLVALALAALRWPRAMLVAVALAPILDRFVIARVMPSDVRGFTQFFSETLLVVVGVVLLANGLRLGRVVPAFRHPASVALAAFVVVSLASTLVNAVPPVIAGAGLFYTLDAVALFYLARIVGFDLRQASLAVGALVAAVVAMAGIGLLQGLLDPNLFGLAVVSGRFGEAVRVGSIVRDPNIFGTLIGITLPFALLATLHLSRRRWRWIAGAAALLLTIALLLTYSRGSWLGVVAGFGLVLVWLDRRALLLTVGLGVVALGVATYMPRSVLVSPSGQPGENPQPAPQFNPWDTTQDRVGAIGEGRDLRTMFVINAIPILRDHPLIGVGPGRYGGAVANDFGTPVYVKYGTDKLLTAQRTVDNFWLHVLIETGVLGALSLIAMLVVVGYRLVRITLHSRGIRYIVALGVLCAAAAITVSTGTTMLLEGNTVAFMFWLVLGIGSTMRAAEGASV